MEVVTTSTIARQQSDGNMATSSATKTPTASDVYDRQIRLWGADAQKKMQSSRVLYINVTGVSSEIIKNLVLAGIAATLCDNRPAACLEKSPCFFTPFNQYDNNADINDGGNDNHEGDIAGGETTTEPAPKKVKASSVAYAVQALVEELNPLLGSCPVLTKDVSELTAEDFSEFTIVVASQIPLQDAVRISQLIKSTGPSQPAFFLVDCFGMDGAAIIDLGLNFQYRPEQGKKLLDPVGLKDGYVPFSDIVSTPLSDCTNRFHKTGPPPIWTLYRCLLEVQARTGHWVGEDESDKSKSKTIVENFLNDQNVSNVSQAEVDQMVGAGMAQIAPVCAVLAGIVGNEVIKVISGKGEPANNILLFDGDTCKMWSFMVKPAEKKK